MIFASLKKASVLLDETSDKSRKKERSSLDGFLNQSGKSRSKRKLSEIFDAFEVGSTNESGKSDGKSTKKRKTESAMSPLQSFFRPVTSAKPATIDLSSSNDSERGTNEDGKNDAGCKKTKT